MFIDPPDYDEIESERREYEREMMDETKWDEDLSIHEFFCDCIFCIPGA